MHYQGIDGYVYNVLENEKIAGGGEGTIYAIQGNDKQVAKIFRDDKKTKDREEKLRLMVSKKMTDNWSILHGHRTYYIVLKDLSDM